MKITLFAAVAALAVAVAAPASAPANRGHATPVHTYRLAATNTERDGGSQPYIPPMTDRPGTEPSARLLFA